MSKQLKAISTIIAGTIGVGFLVLPYAIYKFGTIWGIIILIAVGFLILIINLTYSDIITSDKGNRQIPGYTKKYLGEIPAHIITVVIIAGSLGILLAYGLVSGSALKVILSAFNISLSESFLGLVFVVFSLLVMRYGMQIIAKVSSWAVIALCIVILFLVVISFPYVNLSNISSPNLKEFSLLFGSSIFALYSAGSIPVIDEIIGYSRSTYRRVIFIATFITLIIYIIFALVLSLRLGKSLTSDLVGSFGSDQKGVALILSVLILLATFTSFVLVANNIKEILHYDYEIPVKTAILFIAAALIWAVILAISTFETVISTVGNFSLVLQSLAVFAIWFKSQARVSFLYKLVVGICGLVLIIGMLL